MALYVFFKDYSLTNVLLCSIIYVIGDTVSLFHRLVKVGGRVKGDREMTEALAELVQFVKDIAPAVWGIAVRQAYVEMWQTLIWGVFILLISIGFAGIARWAYSTLEDLCNYDRESRQVVMWGCIMASVIFLAISLMCFSHVVAVAINPEYHAIGILLELAGK